MYIELYYFIFVKKLISETVFEYNNFIDLPKKICWSINIYFKNNNIYILFILSAAFYFQKYTF